MKKMLVILALLLLVFAAAAGDGTWPGSLDAAGLPRAQAISQAPDPVEAAAELVEQIVRYAGKDMVAFSRLYRNTDKEDITLSFQSDWSRLASLMGGRAAHSLISREGDWALVNLVFYEVAGRHPNTNMQSSFYVLPLTYLDGAWKLDYSEESLKASNALNKIVFPEEYLEAGDGGRNARAFGTFNLMYLDPRSVYEGHSNPEIKFAWQHEDGSLRLGIWFANGTGQGIYYSTAQILLEDDKLGTIVDLNDVWIDTIVPAGTSRMVYIDIPAKQVKTKLKAWTSISNSINVNFR